MERNAQHCNQSDIVAPVPLLVKTVACFLAMPAKKFESHNLAINRQEFKYLYSLLQAMKCDYSLFSPICYCSDCKLIKSSLKISIKPISQAPPHFGCIV